MDPLAPVVATVKFSGVRGKGGAPQGLDSLRASKTEDRDRVIASQGVYGIRFTISAAATASISLAGDQ